MSFARKQKRRELRVVSNDESAFRATLALFSAFMHLGIEREELQPGFLPNPSSITHGVAPFIIVTRGKKQLTHRLDQYDLAGTHEQVEKRWREWLSSIMGSRGDFPRYWLDHNYEASIFSGPKVAERLRQSLVSVGIIT